MSTQSVAVTKNASPLPKADEKTSELQKTPPHGMKGALAPVSGMTPQPFLIGACIILLAALLAAIIMFVIDWQRRRRMRNAAGSLLVADPTAWARLRDAIRLIKVPGFDSQIANVDGFSGHESTEPSAGGVEWNHFTSEVSLCLRRALEIRTGMPLAESTTEEILALLSKRQAHLEVLTGAELQKILGRLDRVRFGGDSISQEEGSKFLKDLVDWCDRLESSVPRQEVEEKPIVVVAPTNEKGGLHVFD
jgi:hypothetical protein